MRLTALAARDFMGFEEVDLDLSAATQIVVTGENMAGKSALLDAIRWALFGEIGREVTSKDLVIRDGTDSAFAAVTFSAGASEVVVTREKQRGRTATLSLMVDGSIETKHTIAETEAAIAGLIGLDSDALMAGPFMAQESAAAFMRARPADRKDLLARLFGLDRFERYWRAATDQHKAAEAEATAARRIVEDAEDRITGEEVARSALKYEQDKLAAFTEAQSLAAERRTVATTGLARARTRAERHDALVSQADRLTAGISQNEGAQIALQTRLSLARETLGMSVPEATADALRAAEDALTAAQEADRARNSLTVEMREVTRQVEVLDREVASIETARGKVATVPCGGEGIYAACRFLTDVPDEAALVEAHRAVLANVRARADVAAQIEGLGEPPDTEALRDRWKTLRDGAENARRIETARAAARAQIDEGEQMLQSLVDARAGTEADLDRVRAELAEATDAQSDVAKWSRDLSDAETTYARAREAADRHAASARVHEQEIAQIDAAKALREEYALKVVDLDTLAHSLGILASAFHRDGIPTAILARGIPLIEAEANRVLESLPGGLSITLRTQRAKATGGMAETLDVIVTEGGWEREYGMLSVGGRFRVDIALRLGLARVLTHRTGATIDTVWLDEPLAHLDASGRQALMETLASLQEEIGLIVVVSHHPDFNDAFGARIDVERIDGVSTARLAA